MPTLKTEPQQTDLVTEARAKLAKPNYGMGKRNRELMTSLCDEVERLRKQWNTRFNTLCGLCGKRYLGPRDERLHGYGKCDPERKPIHGITIGDYS